MWITTGGNPIAGQTITTAASKIVLVQTPTGDARSNRSHITETEATSQGNSPTQPLMTTQQPCGQIMTRSQTGTCRPSELLWKGDVVKNN